MQALHHQIPQAPNKGPRSWGHLSPKPCYLKTPYTNATEPDPQAPAKVQGPERHLQLREVGLGFPGRLLAG